MSTDTAVRQIVEGDVFYSSWGYDQTNVDFYEVVRVTPSGKSVEVRRIGKERTFDNGGPTTYVVARRGAFVGEPMLKRLRPPSATGYGYWSFHLSSYADAWLWDGTEQYETGGGWGH